MKFRTVIGTAAVVLLFGTMVPAYPQRDEQKEKQGKPDRSKGRQDSRPTSPWQRAPQPRQQQERARQPTPQPQQRSQRQQSQSQQARSQQTGAQPHPRRTQQQARAWQGQKGWLQQGGGWRGRDTWQQHRAQQWSSDHRTWAQRGGYGGYYVSQDRFRLSFGDRHYFRLRTRPVMYLGYPRFEYSGYSFLLVDPYPEDWSETWYDSDDVYIDYDDGYYLYNRSYPQVRLAITVTL